jgi:PPOX class probable F420-dependent enzyme
VTVLDARTRDLLAGRNFAHVATLMADGAPHAAPVWIDIDGDRIVFCKEESSVAYRNVCRDPRVAISITDLDNPYRCAYIRGVVEEITGEPEGSRRLNELALKYTGAPYPEPMPAASAMIVVRPLTVRSDDFGPFIRRQPQPPPSGRRP